MEVQEYLATIGIRSAELSGLKELPASTKDRLTPVVLLAPWLATSPLARAIQKFEESYPSRDYFIDVDTYYRIIDNPNEAKAQWSSLAQRPANLQVWWSLLADFRHANPCLLMADQNLESARDQITWARENDRSFCIRLNLAEGGAGIPLWMPQLITELASEGTVDYAVVFEFGWVTDALSVATLASGYANTFFSTLPAEVPIAIIVYDISQRFHSLRWNDRTPIHESTARCSYSTRYKSSEDHLWRLGVDPSTKLWSCEYSEKSHRFSR